ncbi:MAG: hypothetical protein GX201_01040 [Clostridiales bacterium]|nr:hypothetical protein [Clostridiales bacterium]
MAKKRTISLLTLIVTVLAIIILGAFKNGFFESKLFLGDIKKLEIDKELIPISNNSVIYNGSDIMVEGENSNIRAKNMEGTILWSMRLEGTISNIIECGNDIVVIIDNKGMAAISRAGELLWQYELVVPASDIFCSDKGLILIQYKDENSNYFDIFNLKGVKLCHGYISNAQVVSFDGFSNKYFTLSLMDISTNRIVTKLATYNNKGEIIWAQDFVDILIPVLKYNEKGELVTICDNSIMKYRGDGRLINEIKVNNPLGKVAINDELVVIMEKNQGYFDINVFDFNLKEIGTAAIKSNIEGIFAGKKDFLVYDKNTVTLFSRQGNIKAFYESNIDINRAYIGDDSQVYIVSNRKLQKLRY